jgi:DEAD/DEAH box helicase domain-containing protein
MGFKEFFTDAGWNVICEENRPSRNGQFFTYDDLGLTENTKKTLRDFERGIYKHQKEAIAKYMGGANVALTTSTSSGKTLVFNVCALQELQKNSNARIAAIYPLKALATEQEDRWRRLLDRSGIDARVGRIDGGVEMQDRLKILRTCKVIVMTPDIIHAWLLFRIQERPVIDFLKNLTLMVIDEVHNYSGVFGSNSAYLFRRILHATRKLGGDVRFIASSATIRDPEKHLRMLTGEDFSIIGPEHDTSEQFNVLTYYVTKPAHQDSLTALSNLIEFSVNNTNHQSITFVDSRKQTEYLATITDRKLRFAQSEETEDLLIKEVEKLEIYPYRSGYEEIDRLQIQKELTNGKLRGVISTSALEMGIDLPNLTLGILHGIPRSATSFFQRIGRVGRKKDGIIIIVNDGSVVSESIFREPRRIKFLPLIQSALYLHNPRIQYIHALCLARSEGEDETLNNAINQAQASFSTKANMPSDFIKLCENERTGDLTIEFQTMKSQAGDDPYHTYPLRDLDEQFRVEHKWGPNLSHLGSLSYAQVLREAYPGAVYYYKIQPYRVFKIRRQQHLIDVRREKCYFTNPNFLPKLILPNLAQGSVYNASKHGDLLVIESGMQIGEAVIGYKEKRGPTETNINYPLKGDDNLYYDAPRFQRYIFTSGVTFTHPALARENVDAEVIAELIYEAFLMTIPFEPRDISFGANRHRTTRAPVKEGERFSCVYDQTYGSLRLTSCLMEKKILTAVFASAVDISRNDPGVELNQETVKALEEMAATAENDPENIGVTTPPIRTNADYVLIIKPGSIGINIEKNNEEYQVDRVFFSGKLNELAYGGKHLSEKKKAEQQSEDYGPTEIIIKTSVIYPLEGISVMGYYNLETGEIVDTVPEYGEF